MSEQEKPEKHKVLINSEEQYSLWNDYSPIPKGWREVKNGSKDECLAYIKENWTDMRPLSLRLRMEQATQDVR